MKQGDKHSPCTLYSAFPLLLDHTRWRRHTFRQQAQKFSPAVPPVEDPAVFRVDDEREGEFAARCVDSVSGQREHIVEAAGFHAEALVSVADSLHGSFQAGTGKGLAETVEPWFF